MSKASHLLAKPAALLRQQLLVDKHVQGVLLRRTALYSGCCAVYFVVIFIFTESTTFAGQTSLQSVLHCLNEVVYWAPGLILMAPVVVYDLLYVTNRFAGPVYRLHREMQKLIDNESAGSLAFRDGDYWTELAVTFNQIRDEMLELRGEPSESSKPTECSETPDDSDEPSSQGIESPNLFTTAADVQDPHNENAAEMESNSIPV
jgi:hypothetical protein